MPTNLGRVTSGLIRAFDTSAIPDGTELHGLVNWHVWESGGPGLGIYKIQGGEIVSNATLSYAMATWADPSVAALGQAVRAEVMSGNWSSTLPGLVANATVLHDTGSDSRCLLGNTWEIDQRSGADYGSGFPISSGTTPGQPLTNGQYYDLLFASIQQVTPGTHARGGMSYNNVQIAMGDSTLGLLTGQNDGLNTYPGLLYYRVAGMHWRNYRVYRDYRLTVKDLIGTQAFRLYDSLGAPILDSPAQSGGEAHINLHTVPWPFTGHIQVFTDTTWVTPVTTGRFPQTSGNDTNIVGGDVFQQVNVGQREGFLINWWDDQEFPGEWTDHDEKDVTRAVVEYDILQMAANPRIEVDTCMLILRDPEGLYVPARTESPLYPNIRLGREMRIVLTEGSPPSTICRFYGKLASVKPRFPSKTDEEPEQRAEIRAESPLRELASSQITLNFAFQGPLVNPDGSGVISSILDLVANTVPADSRALRTTPDVIPEGFLSVGMTVQTALEQCAIYADALYFCLPHYRVATDEPNFFFVWMSRDSHGDVADHTLVDVNNDFDTLDPVYSADVL